MKKVSVISAILLFSFFYLNAQEKHLQKAKVNEVWVTLKSQPNAFKGALYEVDDSTISISNLVLKKYLEKGNFNISRFNYNDIIEVKTRRENSIIRGGTIGAFIGIATMVYGMSQEDISEYRFLLTTLVAIPGAVMGGAIGALAGSVKINIPVENSKEDLNKIKSKLNSYAYIKSNSFQSYEHESYIGILQGPSYPLGNFKGSPSTGSNVYPARPGYHSNIINLGYKISPKLGFTVLAFDNQYDVNIRNSKMWWDWSGFLAGPLFTVPITKRFYFDLKPRIGIASATLALDENTQSTGSGFAIDLNVSLRYNFARRWCVLTETGYLTSQQNIEVIGTRKLQAYNLCFGIAYRFK